MPESESSRASWIISTKETVGLSLFFEEEEEEADEGDPSNDALFLENNWDAFFAPRLRAIIRVSAYSASSESPPLLEAREEAFLFRPTEEPLDVFVEVTIS